MPQKSTEDALYDALTLIRNEMNSKKIVAVISLDIEGAFDGAWWPLMLQQLIRKECPQDMLLLIDSYLSDRSVCVQYAGQEAIKPTSRGCIQGSTCGPVMWNIQLDPLLQKAELLRAHIQAFADDILVVASASTTAELNQIVDDALLAIAEWGRSSKLKFAAQKTQAIVITRRLKYDAPHFALNGVDIQIGSELKVLGLTIDSKLTFKSHLQNVSKKAINIYQKLASTTRANWGLNPKITKLLYTAVVEPIVTYAASAWAPVTNKIYVVNRLNQVTRKFGIMVARAHRTASLASVLCLSGLLPLDLRVKEAAELYEVKRGKPYLELPGREIEKRIGTFQILHPAERNPIGYKLLTTEQDINNLDTLVKIFTDGSKIDGKVGAAATWWENGEEKRCSNFLLAPYCSVYQAELAAILRALEMITRYKTHSASIISDSRSSLESIADPANTHPIVAEIQAQIHELRKDDRHVHLHWIKAHEGFPGNERADELAKAAALTKKTRPAYDKIPISYVKYSLRQKTIDLWNKRYTETETGKVTKLFFPSAREGYRTVLKIPMSNIMAQLFTGHGGFRDYLHRFKLSPSPNCICDSVTPETVPHLLDDCPRYGAWRHEISSRFKSCITCNNYSKFVGDSDYRGEFLKYAERVVRSAGRANGSTVC